MRRLKLGEDHPDTLTTMNNLAGLYDAQEKYSKAEALYAKCLDLKRVKLGEDHPDTLTTMNNLAVVYDAQGKYSRLKHFMQSVLILRE
jgi:Flp pilus assembly protein TadD